MKILLQVMSKMLLGSLRMRESNEPRAHLFMVRNFYGFS